jgi:antitoxin component YwqK of YwqJK toxin-antitoxin module
MGNSTLKVAERQLQYAGFDGGGIARYNYKGKPFTGFIIYNYFKSGTIAAEIEYTNGYQEGVEREFYENGKMKNEFHTKNNMLDGVTKCWDEDGNLISEKIWEKGKLIKTVK